MHHGQADSTPGMQGWFNIQTSINAGPSFTRMKRANHTITSFSMETAFDKIQHPYMRKTTQQSRCRREFPRPDKG